MKSSQSFMSLLRTLMFLLCSTVFVGVGLAVAILAFDGWQSRRDFGQMQTCLTTQNFTILRSWRIDDYRLEGFTLILRSPGDRTFGLDVPSGQAVRDCSTRATHLSIRQNPGDKPLFLPLDHPELVRLSGNANLRTLADLVPHLDPILAWAAENPVEFQERVEREESDRPIYIFLNP